MMAAADVATFITVEAFVPSNDTNDKHGVRCALRAGTRIFRPRAHRGNQTVDVFELNSLGDDIVDIDIMDGNGGNGAVATATFSLAQARQTGSTRLEVPAISTKRGEQVGLLSLFLQWPSSAEASKEAPAASTVTAEASSATPAVAAPMEGAAPAATAEPRKPEQQLPNPFAAQGFFDPEVDQSEDRPLGHEAGAETEPDAATALTSVAAAPAPSAAVMAAMVAVAAMVVAAGELPAACSTSPPSSAEAKVDGASQAPGSGPAATSPPPAVAFYPRIQPYDAAPPLEFGPGQLPTSSTGTAAFYPDIAIKIFRHMPARMQELRPTFSAPVARA